MDKENDLSGGQAARPATVRPPTASDQAWADLAAELTPAKTLDRLDRTDNTVAVVSAVVSGLALFGSKIPALPPLARTVALASGLTAALAVLCMLFYLVGGRAQRFNPANLLAVKAYYERQFNRRYAATWAILFLTLAIVLAIVAAAVALTTTPAAQPAMTIAQTPDPPGTSAQTSTETVTVTSAFHRLSIGQVATTVIKLAPSGRVLASSAVTPAADGTATDTLTVHHIPVSAQLAVVVVAGTQYCRAALVPGHENPTLTCGA
jgi:hypothetical protein